MGETPSLLGLSSRAGGSTALLPRHGVLELSASLEGPATSMEGVKTEENWSFQRTSFWARKTIGKPWENGDFMGFDEDLPSGNDVYSL